MTGSDPNEWIKPAIQAVLKHAVGDGWGTIWVEKDVQVNVENVPYGTWVWNNTDEAHVHLTSRELKSFLGARGYARLREKLVKVKLTWPMLREAAGR